MPRTKITKPSAAKRVRNSLSEECDSIIREIDNRSENFLFGVNLDYDSTVQELENLFDNFLAKFQQKYLNKTIGELKRLQFDDLEDTNLTTKCTDTTTTATGSGSNNTLIGTTLTAKMGNSIMRTAKKSQDDEDSGRSVRSVRAGKPLGPLASSKAKSKRSLSAQGKLLKSASVSSLLPTDTQQNTSSHQHSSRQKYRTPNQMSRTQTMSADRNVLNPVTPKIKINTPLAMLRYVKKGETIISLSGSPVIPHSMNCDSANINIPIANGVLSVNASSMDGTDPALLSQIKGETLSQLKLLQKNLNYIMSHANFNNK